MVNSNAVVNTLTQGDSPSARKRSLDSSVISEHSRVLPVHFSYVRENRTHNKANELQEIANHDADGNMVIMLGLKYET